METNVTRKMDFREIHVNPSLNVYMNTALNLAYGLNREFEAYSTINRFLMVHAYSMLNKFSMITSPIVSLSFLMISDRFLLLKLPFLVRFYAICHTEVVYKS